MKNSILICSLLLLPPFIFAQNIDYESRITSFSGNCDNEAGDEEYTWMGWLGDNTTGVETYSYCVTRDAPGYVVQSGAYAVRNRYNIPATSLRARIEAWEDDGGGRCTYSSGGFLGDDCYVQANGSLNFNNPLEYQWTNGNLLVGEPTMNMIVFSRYRYTTVSLPAATEYAASNYTTAGNRPFWGCRGSWASDGIDCAASGTIGHGGSSSFSTTVRCQRQVSFRWRVDSEANHDFLEVYVNGTRRDFISGLTGWTNVTLNLDVGENTIEWRYSKDGSLSSGLDRGFVDNISFTASSSVIAGTITGNESVGCNVDPSIISSTAPAQAYSNTLNYQWQSSTNNVFWTNIVGATGVDYDPPVNLPSTTYFRRRVFDGCGFTGYSNTVIKSKIREFVHDGTWCPNDPSDLLNPSNSADNVYIRANLNQSSSFVAGNLTIDAGVTAHMMGTTSVEVHNSLNLNGTLNLNGQGQLVQPNNSTVSLGSAGKIQVIRYGNPSIHRYTYWGSPVSNPSSSSNSGFTIGGVMKDGTTTVARPLTFTSGTTTNGAPGNATVPATIASRWLYAFRDLNSSYANWESLNATDQLLTGQGYTMKGTGTNATSQAYIFEGTPNNGDIVLPMTSGNSYLISNPYPSALDAHQFLLNNPHLDGTLYFWEHYGGDTHIFSDYQGGYALYNLSGGIGAPSLAVALNGVSNLGVATKLPARYIPVGQGFFVSSTTTGNLNFSNDMRVHAPEINGTSVFIKSASSQNNNHRLVDTRTKLRLGMTTPQQGHRQLLLTEDPNSTNGVDKFYDGELFDHFSNDVAFDLNNKNYGIQGIPQIDHTTIIPLVVDVSVAGDFEFMIDHLEHWNNGLPIYLYDDETATYHDLMHAPVILNLRPGNHLGRFSLKFQNSTLSIGENVVKDPQFTVFQKKNQNILVIQFDQAEVSLDECILHDLNGRNILKDKGNKTETAYGSWEIDTSSVASGYYILSLKSQNHSTTRKVLLHQF
ncbi:T9SS type A sorting domain-containing protein [Nonlabens xiamenensis]|uniref:T9SS type A sorting domain-containing protein n=1 Tax=Nonlabens xiamenensis TaxID=2341043 RepID=UPI000F614838|nr:T9SS type A sorting domain-containing protein [Nonlabens xiamenensis]